ncbi:hypothetical protein B7494_g1804 [Chlorociboria aeruginascens]|nr:hypothetical protein B7494_g1804 [Chlorociboria aeruginascens]
MEMLPHNYLRTSERELQKIEIPSDIGWDLKSGSVLIDHTINPLGSNIFQGSGGPFRQFRSILEDDDDDADILNSTQTSETKALQGARSLQTMVIRCIVRDQDDYELMAGTLPCPMSLNLWKLFSKHFRGDYPYLCLLRYRQQIRQCKSPLDVYTIPITSKAFDFIAYLSLTTAHSSADLIRLSDMTNLGILEVYNSYVKSDFHPMDQNCIYNKSPLDIVDDRLVRAWSMAATETGAFPVLRILKLWCHRSITERSLSFISSFPSLAVYDIYGCGFSLGAAIKKELPGWRPTVDPHILGLLETACIERIHIMQMSMASKTWPAYRKVSTQLDDCAPTLKLPREDIPSFLINKYQDKPNSQSSRILPTWEFANYTAFARIGELRNDKDLRRAGIETGYQLLVSDEPINSIPIVSLRVGPTPNLLKHNPIRNRARPFHRSVFSDERITLEELKKENSNPSAHLAFLRIKLPPLEASVDITLKRSSDRPSNKPSGEKCDIFRVVPGIVSGGRNHNRDSVVPEAVSPGEASTSKKGDVVPDITSSFSPTRKRKGSVMRLGKKLKLGSILGSFGV